MTFSDTVPFKACPPRFASCSPASLRSASNQPQKRFSWFQQLSPWRISTSLYAAILTPMPSTLYFRELRGKWLLLKGSSSSNALRFSRTSPKPWKFLHSNRSVIALRELEWWQVCYCGRLATSPVWQPSRFDSSSSLPASFHQSEGVLRSTEEEGGRKMRTVARPHRLLCIKLTRACKKKKKSWMITLIIEKSHLSHILTKLETSIQFSLMSGKRREQRETHMHTSFKFVTVG